MGMCHAGYFVDGTNGCTACIANCSACTTGTACSASSCNAGYINNATTNVCDACPANCGTCTDATTCTSSGCNTGFFKNSTGGCTACPANCDSCTDASTCSATGCATGYTESSGSCVACTANCNTCDDASDCNSDGCATGYSYVASSTSCTVTLTALDCDSNQYLDETENSCVDCGENCLVCTSAVCVLCEDGNGPVTGGTPCAACTSSASGMATCTADLATAYTCDSGYGNIAGTCTACTVANCFYCTSADVCSSCVAGYGMMTDGSACHACSEGCASCSSNCERSCTLCLGTGRTAPNCSCSGATPNWNATTLTCDGETVPEAEPTDTGSTSANILKFAGIVLVALIALL